MLAKVTIPIQASAADTAYPSGVIDSHVSFADLVGKRKGITAVQRQDI